MIGFFAQMAWAFLFDDVALHDHEIFFFSQICVHIAKLLSVVVVV